MDNVKLSLNLYVPGAKMLSSQVCEENPTENYDRTRIEVLSGGKKKNKETITVATRKIELVRQHMNLTLDAFLYMTGKEVPSFEERSKWLRISKKERLKAHLDRIAENFNAVKYTYDVLDD